MNWRRPFFHQMPYRSAPDAWSWYPARQGSGRRVLRRRSCSDCARVASSLPRLAAMHGTRPFHSPPFLTYLHRSTAPSLRTYSERRENAGPISPSFYLKVSRQVLSRQRKIRTNNTYYFGTVLSFWDDCRGRGRWPSCWMTCTGQTTAVSICSATWRAKREMDPPSFSLPIVTATSVATTL